MHDEDVLGCCPVSDPLSLMYSSFTHGWTNVNRLERKRLNFFSLVGRKGEGMGASGCGSSGWVQVFEIRTLEVRSRAQNPFRGYFTIVTGIPRAFTSALRNIRELTTVNPTHWTFLAL